MTSPQSVQFEVQATGGGSQDYGSDWVAYALATAAPDFVGGVDHSLNPPHPDAAQGAPEAYA